MTVSSLLIVRGIVGILAGLLAITWPALTIAFLVSLFGAYALVDGVANLVRGLRRTPTHDRSMAAVFQGIVGIVAGVLVFLWPQAAALALLLWIGAWAVVTGVLEVAAAIRLRREIRGEWILAVAGVLSIVFGVILFAFPAIGAIGLAWGLGMYAMASGILLVALGIRLRTAVVAPA